MGNQDNPIRQLKRTFVVGGTGVLLFVGIGFGYSINEIHEKEAIIQKHEGTIQKQGVRMKEDKQELVEKGSLIDRQEGNIKTLTTEKEKLQTTIKGYETKVEKKDEIIRSKDKVISGLEKDLRIEKKKNRQPVKVASKETNKGYRELTVSATGYTAYCEGCTGLTKWKEMNLRKNPGLKVIAVDPAVIPLGSKVYVEGYGDAVAADIGGAINGHEVDLFYPQKKDADAWGVRTVKMKVYY